MMRLFQPPTSSPPPLLAMARAAWGRGLVVLLLPVALTSGQTVPSTRVVVPGSHTAVAASGGANRDVPVLSRATLTTTEADATIEIEVSLRMRDLAGLEVRVHRGERISPQELEAKYQPAAADFQAVTNWLVGQGLTVNRTNPSQVAVFARGTVRQLASVFQVTFARVAFHGAEFTSAITPPSLPPTLARAVLGVNGLQPHLRPHKHLLPGPKPLSTASTTAPPYWPRDVLLAYGGTGLTQSGAGQTIGIVIDSFPVNSDLTSFWSTTGVNQSLANIESVPVAGGPAASSQTADLDEATLDVEWSSGIAPGAKIRVYGVPDLDYVSLDQAYAQINTDVSTGAQPNLQQISLSFGEGETEVSSSQLQTDEQYFAELAAVGVTVFASSGDGGSNPHGVLQVEAPASSTSVIGVGGTSLMLDPMTGAITSETVWIGTGGGSSVVFSRPSWQVGTGVAAGTFRLVPDVAAPADPGAGALVYLDGFPQTYGGTSWSSPTWAGFCALINQARAGAGYGSLGLLAPNLYPLLGTTSLRDITSGGNGVHSAGVGYDETTGLGVPVLPALLNALTNPALITAATQTQTVAPGANAVFSVVASGVPPLALQWQRLPVGGGTWVNLTDQSPYSGSATAALTIHAVTGAMTGDQFRCIVSNPFATVTSIPAGLIVALPCLVRTVAGIAGTTGGVNGPALGATFNFPNGIGVDGAGNLYLGDMGNDAIRKITPAGVVSTFAGTTGVAGDSPTGLNGPTGVTWDASTGNIYVLDYGNNNVRKITPAGVMSLLAGSGSGAFGYTDSPTGTGALFAGPADVSVDAAGNLYVADQGNNVIRMITPTGAVSTLAGSGTAGSADGTGTAASFNAPGGIGIDAAGNLYVADSYNHTIRKIAMPGAVVTTLAGSPGVAGSADGFTGADARFNTPGDVQPDAFGNVFVIDSGNDTLREILATGPVITVAGVALNTGSTDGIGSAARFEGPGSIILEPAGTLAIADTSGNTVRRATPLVVPTVQVGPGALTVVAGGNAVFAATIIGAPAPIARWRRLPAGATTWVNLADNGTYLGSATATLTVAGTTAAMNGDQFECVVTNAAGTATSAPATLTVQAPPQITSSAGTAFFIGAPGSFTVTATGSPAPTFSATGLPAWATFDPVGGILTGTPPNGGGSPFVLTFVASNGAAPTASQNFTLVVLSPLTFGSWQAANFTPAQLANPAISGPAAVLGPDSATNFLKYAFGVLPTAAVPPGGQTVTVSGPVYTFTHTRPAANTDLTYTVQVSADLENWSSTGVTQQLLSTDATGMQTWQAQYPTTASAAFFRLLITQP
jgi:kumamolisin